MLDRVAILLVVITILTSSSDIFLTIQLGGTYRLCQIAALLLLALALVKCRRLHVTPVLGGMALLIWLVVQFLFMPVSSFWPKSVAYCGWLALNVGTIFAFVQLFARNETILAIVLRCYAISFAVVALFGIVQVTLPLIGFGGPLVEQWWIPERLARANGFSYEPSYFATYLLLGAVFTGALRRAQTSLLSRKSLNLIYWICVFGILASSSRMGIAVLLLDILLHHMSPWLAFWRQLFGGRIVFRTVRSLIPSLALLALLGTLTVEAERLLETNPIVALMFLNGTGVSNTAAHSVIQREDALGDTLRVFYEHPFVGQSLGGISSAIADLHGETITSFEASKAFEGMNVFAEALAASGILGIIPFIVFLLITIQRPLKLARVADPFYATLLRSLVRALLFGWIALQFNQNLLRPYLWMHLAILACTYSAAQLSLNVGQPDAPASMPQI